jgi:hypothetical protein
MMKIRVLVVLCFAVLSVLPLTAQEVIPEKSKSEYYYVNVPIEKIYPYRKGYMVLYRKGVTDMARTYLPIEWFTEAAGRGELIPLGTGSTWPSLSVYYKNGEFSHVRLYVRRDISHVTWGTIGPGVNIDNEFDNVDDLRLEF